jgi:copper chaperone CopZ
MSYGDPIDTPHGYRFTDQRGPPVNRTTTYTVVGMTCGHCVSSVSEEVGALAGVESVDVDLATGTLTVTADASVDEPAVRSAVEEAGYALEGLAS